MAAIVAKFTDGPPTADVAEPVLGGQLVEARTSPTGMRTVGVAAAGSLRVVGVAQIDAAPASVQTGNNWNAVILPVATVVLVQGDVPVTYSTAAVHGDTLIAAAGGQVAVTATAPDPRAVVGTCTVAAGVAAGAVGRMRIKNAS